METDSNAYNAAMQEFKEITGPLLQEFIQKDKDIKIEHIKLITEILKRLNSSGFMKIEPKFAQFVELLKHQDQHDSWEHMIRVFDFSGEAEKIL